MSDSQIQQILKAMEEQNKVLASIREEQYKAKERLDALEIKLEPVHQVFESVSGFNSIAIWILKSLIMFGAGIGVLYGLITWLKK